MEELRTDDERLETKRWLGEHGLRKSFTGERGYGPAFPAPGPMTRIGAEGDAIRDEVRSQRKAHHRHYVDSIDEPEIV